MSTVQADLKTQILSLPGPIAIFGAGGFIGVNLLSKILKVRGDVYGITHQPYLNWRLNGYDSTNIVYCDVTDKNQVQRAFESKGFKTVFYLAAFGAYSWQKDPELIYQTNFLGLINVSEIGRRFGLQRIINAGSSSEYGNVCSNAKEDDQLHPNSHYAVSKVATSHYCKYIATHSDVKAINLRYFSVYGPWEDPNRLIPTVIEFGFNNKYPPLVNPEITRDFIYVDDAVEATILAGCEGIQKLPGGSLNICSGRKTSIREVATIAKSTFKIEESPQWESMPNRTWDINDWYGDPSLAEKILKWRAKTLFEEGILKTAEWHKANKSALPAVATAVKSVLRLSSIIACYKDAQAIPYMYQRLKTTMEKIGVDYEIIFVNDASPDNSNEVLEQIIGKDPRVIALEHSRNFGSQSAFLSGMEIATGDAVILLDGDLQDPPEVIESFYQKWREGFEVVWGRRVKRDASWHLNLGYKTFYKIFSSMAYIPIPKDAGDFSLIDRKVVKEIVALPETEQFLRGLRAWVGFRQVGVDYFRPERMFGKSTNNLRKNIMWARKAIFGFSFVPLEFLMYFGIGTLFLSITGILFSVVNRLMGHPVTQGVTTIVILILFFSGVQILSISIIGEYVGKIFEESKKRPKYIRRTVRTSKALLQTHDEISEFVNSRKA